MRLFTYTVAYDYGAAPNPYWDVCTLTICKPVIRRVAEAGDWIAGFSGNNLVYAMRVTKKLSLADYDAYCKKEVPGKIPNWKSKNYRRVVGDCIYDYSRDGGPSLRESVHDGSNIKTDLGGKFALLSDDYYYFGDEEISLPDSLFPIWHGRGHKSNANDPYKNIFVSWLRKLDLGNSRLIGNPKLKTELENNGSCKGHCSKKDKEEAEQDEIDARKAEC